MSPVAQGLDELVVYFVAGVARQVATLGTFRRVYPTSAPVADLLAFEFGYGLYADGVRVASFAEGRIGYREWARRNGRPGDIHSIDDRYEHDVDELMV
jgi:hypothetical protein